MLPAPTGAPDASEYAPYYGKYVSLVKQGDIISLLAEQVEETLALLANLPEERGAYRYAPEKWSIKELVGHISDTERIFSYRALRMARADETPLSGYEQDDYVRAGDFDGVPLRELAEEFRAVRSATLFLFRHLSEAAWMRRGTADGKPFTVRALSYIIAGHELHHREVLRSRYL